MGGGIVVIFFGFLLMWGATVVPAYAIIRRPLFRLHFILRVFLAIIFAFILALVAGILITYWRSKTLLAWYFGIAVIASLVIPVVLFVRKLSGGSSDAPLPKVPVDPSTPWQ